MVGFAALLAACGPGNNGNNGASNNGASNNGASNNGTAGTSNQTVDNSGAEYADEYELKFDTLAFTNTPASSLNSIVANSLDLDEEFPIVVLIQMGDFDQEAGTGVLTGGSGFKTDDDTVFTFDEDSDPTPTEFTIDFATGAFDALVPYFGFVSTFKFENDVSKTILPIQQLQINGNLSLSDDGAEATIGNGTMAGYITKEDGDVTEITLVPGNPPATLTQIFKAENLNWDSEAGMEVDKGEGDAWYITGEFTAIDVEIDD